MEGKKRSQFSVWTPSLPRLEAHLTFTSPFIPIYRLVRLTYLILTTPLHLTCLFLSLPPLSFKFPSIFASSWTITQRLVYPFLRRLIWAVADVGDPNVLTRSVESGVPPWWAEGLEWFTVRIGGGKKVSWEIERVGMPREAYERDYVTDEIRGKEGGVEVKKVNLFWFERSEDQIKGGEKEGFEPKRERERIVLYFFGGGFVCGSPGEGGRCYKIARETGLRVVGVNYRRATSRERSFPAALQDALSAYFHLTLKLGYKDLILAGDSAGGGLALNLIQYLAGTVCPSLSEEEKRNFVLPSAMVLFSPWCDLTLDSFLEHNKLDIILPSICSNSVEAYLGQLRTSHESKGGSYGSIDDNDSHSTHTNDHHHASGVPRISEYKDPSHHPWFSPALRSSLPSLSLISECYASSHRRPLRILVSLGTAELFYGSILSLIDNFRNVANENALELEVMEGVDEVHAFPLVPEWVSPTAVKSWERLRVWFKE